MKIERFNIGKIAISATNISQTLLSIDNTIKQNNFGYICVTNSRTAHLSNHDDVYCKIQNNSLLTIPDGAPLVWIAHNKGYKNVGRITGKDLMDALFAISVEKGYSHYFYGSSPETISQLKLNLEKQYLGIEIKEAISPPFQPLEEFDIDRLANQINNLKPTFFWCGLGAPKQELLNALLQPKLDSTICIGVGLAFEYIGGTVKRAPKWMRKSGLEGVYRLIQQPKNIKRAFKPLSWVFLKLIKSYIRNDN